MIKWEEILPNPYSERIFTEIKKREWNRINKLVKEKMNFPIDRISGNIGRMVWNGCINTLKQAEKEGKICRVPSEEEIMVMIRRLFCVKEGDSIRIKGGEFNFNFTRLKEEILKLLRGEKNEQ